MKEVKCNVETPAILKTLKIYLRGKTDIPKLKKNVNGSKRSENVLSIRELKDK